MDCLAHQKFACYFDIVYRGKNTPAQLILAPMHTAVVAADVAFAMHGSSGACADVAPPAT